MLCNCSTLEWVTLTSRTIFRIFPSSTDTKWLLLGSQFGAVSRWALDLLLQQYKVHESDAAANFYYRISRMPEAASLRVYLFERQVLNHLCRIDTKWEFSIRGLTDSNQMTWTHSGPVRHITFQESTIFSEITKAFRNREPLHLIPLVHDFPAVDSILYDPNDPNAVLTCIQITRNEEHPIDVSGFLRIQSWLKFGTPLENLCPYSKENWP